MFETETEEFLLDDFLDDVRRIEEISALLSDAELCWLLSPTVTDKTRRIQQKVRNAFRQSSLTPPIYRRRSSVSILRGFRERMERVSQFENGDKLVEARRLKRQNEIEEHKKEIDKKKRERMERSSWYLEHLTLDATFSLWRFDLRCGACGAIKSAGGFSLPRDSTSCPACKQVQTTFALGSLAGLDVPGWIRYVSWRDPEEVKPGEWGPWPEILHETETFRKRVERAKLKRVSPPVPKQRKAVVPVSRYDRSWITLVVQNGVSWFETRTP